ncbi:MAG: hypothetical protein HN730_04305 [Bdellovibrionales bacterium]|jgi:DNA polymerase III epsilon subunit-like protein|nr:hypothetical protein [Bdellovibrionales bacterium]
MKQKPFVAISVVTDDIRPHEVRGRLIKIEMVKNHLDGKIEILSEFVNPERTMTMGMQIDKGIINDTLQNALPFHGIAHRILDFIGGYVLVGREMEKTIYPMLLREFKDVYTIFDVKNRIDIDVLFSKMEDCLGKASLDFYGKHDSGSEARNIHAIFIEQMRRYY